MGELLSFTLSGLFFGLVAGISPGPLFMLVISETLKYNRKQGVKIALVPLLTDLPIILITFYILSVLTTYNSILSIVTFIGAAFILYLAYECLKTNSLEINAEKRSRSILKGIIANILSPHPYLFWISVGGPIFFRAKASNITYAIIFIFGFYLMLIGSKVVIALFVDRSKNIINTKWFSFIFKLLGIVLFIFAFLFIKEGIGLLRDV